MLKNGRHVYPFRALHSRRKTEYGSRFDSNVESRRNTIRIQDSTSSQIGSPVIAESNKSIQANAPFWRISYRRYLSSSSLAMYSGIFLLIMSLVAIGYQPPEHASAAASALSSQGAQSDDNTVLSVDADDIVAANLAANLAVSADLPVASNVANLSQSLAAESMLSQNDANIVSKPQIIQPSADSREILTYKAKVGDTVQKIASRYGVSVNTIKWANNLTSDAVEAGKVLKILPVDGVLYKVTSGDSIDKIADRYNANREQIIAFNDLEIGGLKNGNQLIIPSGSLPQTERPGYTAPAANQGVNSGGYGSVNPFLAGASAGNRYAFGNCTWYAYERRAQLGKPIGSFWGNANTWSMYARAAGFNVNGTPAPGAIMEGGGWVSYGHVAIVESVNPGVSVTISEMNAYRFGGGFNTVGRGEIPWNQATSGMFKYIH